MGAIPGLWGARRSLALSQTNSGRMIDLVKPDPKDIELRDIVMGISQICRYTGQTRHFYSVAEHSVLVARALIKAGESTNTVFAGLMHDSTEAYIGDVASPIQRAIRVNPKILTEALDALRLVGRHDIAIRLEEACGGFAALEARVYSAIAERFAMFRELPDEVKLADLRMLATEAPLVLAWPPPFDWGLPETAQPYPEDNEPEFWGMRVARGRFLDLFIRYSPCRDDRDHAIDLLAELG